MSRRGAPVSGSRTWQWTTAAPAFAASIAASAICFGERGTWGLRFCVLPEPVTAQVMNTSRFIANGMASSLFTLGKDDAPLAGARFALYEFCLMHSERRSIFVPDQSPLRLAFLVLPGTSIMCVASAVDPLRAANRVTGEKKFDWTIVSPDGENPLTTAGLPVQVAGKFDPAAETDVIVAVGGFGTRRVRERGLLSDIRKAARRARAFGGIEAGSWALGYAGLLEGRAATTHWEDLEDFAVSFPGCNVRPDRYVIDGPVFTSGGASPT